MLSKLLKIIRIKEWVHFLGVPILGYFFKSSEIYFLDIILIIIIGIITLSYGFVINYWANINDNYRPTNTLIINSLLLIPIAFAILIFFSVEAYIFWFLTVLLLFLYSFPPFILKRFPIVVTLLNSIALSLFFIFGFAIQNKISSSGIIFSCFWGLNLVPLQLIHEWQHKEQDLENNCVPTAAFFSTKNLQRILVFLYLLVLVFAFYISYEIGIHPYFRLLSSIFVFISIALVFYFYKINKITSSRKPLKVAGAIYSFIILLLLVL